MEVILSSKDRFFFSLGFACYNKDRTPTFWKSSFFSYLLPSVCLLQRWPLFAHPEVKYYQPNNALKCGILTQTEPCFDAPDKLLYSCFFLLYDENSYERSRFLREAFLELQQTRNEITISSVDSNWNNLIVSKRSGSITQFFGTVLFNFGFVFVPFAQSKLSVFTLYFDKTIDLQLRVSKPSIICLLHRRIFQAKSNMRHLSSKCRSKFSAL